MRNRDRRSEIRCKAVLAALLLLGAALLFGGLWGTRQAENAAFSQENAFSLISGLSGNLSALWSRGIRPALESSSADTEKVLSRCRESMDVLWKDEDRQLLADSLQGLSGDALAEREMKLLSASFALNGPKIKTASRKKLTVLSGDDLAKMQDAILRSVAGENAALPEPAGELCKGLEGPERLAMLVQCFLSSANRNGELLPADTVTELKKAARTDAMKASACVWAAEGKLNWITQLLCSGGRTAVLLGILLLLDTVVLFFWQLRERQWRLDVKWLIILLIVDFLLVFQLLPTANMLFRAFFPDGRFSFSTVARLYTENLNLSALLNTLIAAVCTMVLGTLLAFPLAWLVGRTNLYARRFFRALFVMTYMVPPYVGAMAWLRLLNPNVGDINLFLRNLFGLGDVPGPLNIYSLPGLVWVLSTFYYP